MSEDLQCVCKGNWRKILSDVEHLIDREFTDQNGRIFTFFGLVHGGDDYYYGMYAADDLPRNSVLLSCVGSIAGHGYELLEDVQEDE